MIKVAVVAATLALAACSADKTAPMAEGSWQVLNAGQWDVNPALMQPPAMPKEAK